MVSGELEGSSGAGKDRVPSPSSLSSPSSEWSVSIFASARGWEGGTVSRRESGAEFRIEWWVER
jgi:hypothetical protein